MEVSWKRNDAVPCGKKKLFYTFYIREMALLSNACEEKRERAGRTHGLVVSVYFLPSPRVTVELLHCSRYVKGGELVTGVVVMPQVVSN
jgi:hypothetical protein